MRAKNRILLCLTLVWMLFIFCMSAAPAEESTEMSIGAGFVIGRFIFTDFDQWSDEEQLKFSERIEYPLRKGAHAAEYAILYILVCGTFLTSTGVSFFQSYGKGLGFFVTACYAASDELHQLFVPGRSGQLTDILIDCTGALAGMLLLYTAGLIRNARKRRR